MPVGMVLFIKQLLLGQLQQSKSLTQSILHRTPNNMITLSYPSLKDFSGLPALREAVANREQGFLVHNLPPLPAGIQVDTQVRT